MTDKQYVAYFLCTVELVISDVCTNLENSQSCSASEMFDNTFRIHYI